MAGMNIACRVDASPAIGTGHFMRCLTLADAWRERGAAIRFLSRRAPEHLQEMLAERGYELAALDCAGAESGVDDLAHSSWLGTTQRADAEASAHALASRTWDWIVVDHYALDERWERTMRGLAGSILVVDDLADRRHDCDVLVDHNLHANAADRYAGRVPEACQALLGPEYALLRPEFARARAAVKARTEQVSRVLVSFGGVDVDNHTGMAIEALVESGIGFRAVDVVIGAHHRFRGRIESACEHHGFHLHVQTGQVAALMADADLAIGAGGVTTWERCCLGLPALVVPAAANQVDQIRAAALEGLLYAPAGQPSASMLALHVRALATNPLLRETLSRNGMRAVDGRGVERVVRVMDRAAVGVREATIDDAVALFNWRNDETVRMASRDSRPISWSAHEAWLGKALADDACALLVGEWRGQPVGVVRFDVRESRAEVSIYRISGSGESGLAPNLLLASEQWLATRRPDVTSITAEVLAENERSHRLFRSAGYTFHSAHYQKPLRTS